MARPFQTTAPFGATRDSEWAEFSALAADSSREAGSSWRGALAAVLSFLLPGLGQLYNGQVRAGLLILLLLPLLVVPLVVLPLVERGSLVGSLFDTQFLVRLLVLDLLLLGVRVVAIAQAHARRATIDFSRAGTYVTVTLLAVTLGMHTVTALFAAQTIETLNTVSLGGGGDQGIHRLFGSGAPPPSALHLGPGSTKSPSPTPTTSAAATPTPAAATPTPAPATPTPAPVADIPINILLVGADQRPNTDGYLTDTLMVLSLHPQTGESVMFSLRRDMYNIPLADGRTYQGKINAIAVAAERNPALYPEGPMQTLKGAVATLLDVPIDYVIAIDLQGFQGAVDALGGVQMEVQETIADPTYRDPYHPEMPRGFYIEPGWYQFDGYTALAYVRSRKGPNNGETARVQRQQRLLVAVRDQLAGYDLAASLPSLLDVIGPMVATDIPVERMPELATAVEQSDVSSLQRVVLTAPDYLTEGRWKEQYVLEPNLERIRALADELLQ